MSISRKRLIDLSKIKDSEIDYSDIPELDDEFWKNAKLMPPLIKKPVSLRIDHDVLEWFKKQGKGYQTLINSVLKSYMQAHKH